MRLAVLAVLAALLLPRPLEACSCACVVAERPPDAGSVRSLLARPGNALLGRVVKVEPSKNPADVPPEYAARIATVRVIREWKGERRKEYRIDAGLPGAGGCGYAPVVGKVHLFVNGLPGGFDSCCPEPSRAELRRLIALLDEETGKKPLRLPRELR